MWNFRICDCIKYLKSNCALAKDRNSTSKQIARYNSFLKNTVGDRKNQDLQSQLCIRLHCYVKKQKSSRDIDTWADFTGVEAFLNR